MSDSYWSLDTFIDAFVAALRERPGLDGVQVEDGWPGQTQERRSIWFEEAQSFEQDPRMRAGPVKSVEVYSVYFVCDVLKEGGSQRDAMAELTPLVGEVMREVAESKGWYGEAKINAARIAGWKYRTYVTKTGRGAACRIEIKITGRR